MLDGESIEDNRQGRLSESQGRLVRSEMQGWLINGMFSATVGLLAAFALPSPVLKVLVGLVAVGVAVYMASKGYDCARDSVDGRVAVVTGGFEVHSIETGSTSGMRVLTTLYGRRFWVPVQAREIVDAASATVYFTPRARVVVNVEPETVE